MQGFEVPQVTTSQGECVFCDLRASQRLQCEEPQMNRVFPHLMGGGTTPCSSPRMSRRNYMPLYLITQSELVTDLSEKTGFPKGEVKHMLVAIEEYVAEQVKRGNRVKLAGGIVVEPRLKKATKSRMGRNPQTGEPVKIKAKPATVKLSARINKPLSDAKLPSVKTLQSYLDGN